MRERLAVASRRIDTQITTKCALLAAAKKMAANFIFAGLLACDQDQH
jgi:hypothetical protein